MIALLPKFDAVSGRRPTGQPTRLQMLLSPRAKSKGLRLKLGKRSGFTVMELLTVAGIIVLLLGLMVPAYTRIGRANALTTAGNRVADLVALARQNAMTRNALTALIIAGQGDAAILYELKPTASGSLVDESGGSLWKPISKWEVLPAGIIVDETNFADSGRSGELPVPLPEIRRENKPVTSYYFVAFMPRGAVYPRILPADAEKNPYVRLAEGIRKGNEVTYTAPSEDGEGAANVYRVTIMAATGLTKIARF